MVGEGVLSADRTMFHKADARFRKLRPWDAGLSVRTTVAVVLKGDITAAAPREGSPEGAWPGSRLCLRLGVVKLNASTSASF